MVERKMSTGDPRSISFLKQPVFDARRHLWGYKLFCLGNKAEALFEGQDDEGIAAAVASSAYVGLNRIVGRGKKIIMAFDEREILDHMPYAFPPLQAAVKVPEKLQDGESALELLKALKDDGYMIALDVKWDCSASGAVVAIADIICLDMAEQEKFEIPDVFGKFKGRHPLLMADRVEDHRMFDACRGKGFDLFCGGFFKAAEDVSVRKMSAGEISRFHIFQVIEKEDADFDALSEMIQADVTISYRLLSYLNSVAFGFTQRIKSIRHAIALLGWRKIKNWLHVLLIADMTAGKDTSELVSLAAQRSKFLEKVGGDHDYWGFDPDSLSLLGLFSLLDTMLGVPMEEIVRFLPLDDKLKAALCREPNNEYLPILVLAERLEEARWQEGEFMIQQLSLDSAKVKEAFRSAVEWADGLSSLDTPVEKTS